MTAPVRVLVVDDDAAARALHARCVAAIDGFAVVGTAGTGRAAVEIASSGRADLVLLDLRLPDISGVDVLNRLRAFGSPSPDVIVISSSRDQVTVRQAMAGRISGYLVKPFTEEALAARMVAYLADHRPRPRHAFREQELAQGDIDRLLATGAVRQPAPAATAATRDAGLPKGLTAVTMARVRDALDTIEPRSAAEVADAATISRASARRYLDHLVSRGEVDIAHRYGRRGRPEVLYRLAPG